MNQIPSDGEFCRECDEKVCLAHTWQLCVKYHEFLKPYNYPMRLPICLKERPQVVKGGEK